MEETTVLIVGAGPSGLALGALLGRMNVKVVMLEKDTEVCEDPRGIVVNGDAVRISYQIGIGEGLTKRIGKDIGVLNFHRGNFRTSPFMTFDIRVDWAEQAVSNNITQFQPNYEREIRAILKDFPSCELRTGCEVLSRRQESDNSTVIEYVDQTGTRKSIRTRWLVGADGKRGVVRKKFLEPEGIRQEESDWTYVGTWVAANLHITTPTPESHPDFPLWKLGYTPEQVHDAFWPSGFHFCNDSKRPAVSGRFGPPNSGFWRHEYSVELEDDLKDVQSHFWSLFAPWMVIPGSTFSRALKQAVEFPRDCINVVRCRPFTFAVKVVNRWFSKNAMLIGDAAHVFPPFGGQGIATGIRDAQALGWRLAMMSRLGVSQATQERILTGWAQERRHGWKASLLATKLNGSIVNQRSAVWGFLYRTFMRLLWKFKAIAWYRTHNAFRDKLIYNHETCPDGFFLESGGRKVAQVWVRKDGEPPKLSDSAVLRNLSHLSLLVLVRRGNGSTVNALHGEVAAALKQADLPGELVTMDDVTFYEVDDTPSENTDTGSLEIYHPCTAEELATQGVTPIQGYRHTAIQDRFSPSTRFVLVRPDFFVHSVAANQEELLANLGKARDYFS